MIPAGTTGQTRTATALASQAARLSRWPAGTLAAAGTIPARTMSSYATLVISQGHHSANQRSAIPTREYESGSGYGHDAAPAGHPHPPRPPPETRKPEPCIRGPGLPIIGSRQPPSRPPAASPCERSAHLDPDRRSHDPAAIQAHRIRQPRPLSEHHNPANS